MSSHVARLGLLLKVALFFLAFDLLIFSNSLCHDSVFGEEDPFPGQYWEAARDGHLLFCAGEGVDAGWVESTLEHDWGLQLTHECTEPDLIIRSAVGLEHPTIGGLACGFAYVDQLCILEIEETCLAGGPFYQPNAAEIVLDHEVGHCLGLGHRDHGVMYERARYLPTEEDVALVHERYGLNVGLVPVPYRMPEFTVCTVDEANTGIDSKWTARLLSSDWNAHVSVDCENPDVFLTIIHSGYGRAEWWPRGWIYEIGGPIWVDARLLDFNYPSGMALFRAAIDHEVGHVFGMQHVDYPSVMSIRGPYMPTLGDWMRLSEILSSDR